MDKSRIQCRATGTVLKIDPRSCAIVVGVSTATPARTPDWFAVVLRELGRGSVCGRRAAAVRRRGVGNALVAAFAARRNGRLG